VAWPSLSSVRRDTVAEWVWEPGVQAATKASTVSTGMEARPRNPGNNMILEEVDAYARKQYDLAVAAMHMGPVLETGGK